MTYLTLVFRVVVISRDDCQCMGDFPDLDDPEPHSQEDTGAEQQDDEVGERFGPVPDIFVYRVYNLLDHITVHLALPR